MFLIVPDNDTSLEFVATDMREAHGTCYARGYKSFDVWSLPNKYDPILTTRQGGVIYDDGAQILKLDVKVERSGVSA